LGFSRERDVACEGTAVHPDDIDADRGINVSGDLAGGCANVWRHAGIVVDEKREPER
jgi:hypothetical protein